MNKMREILFKAIRVDNKEWIFGSYVGSGDRHYITNSIHIMEREIENEEEFEEKGIPPIFSDGLKLGIFHLVDGNTVCQFTGSYDADEDKIFENDILFGSGREWVVKFINGSFYLEDTTYKINLAFIDIDLRNFVIVGNSLVVS